MPSQVCDTHLRAFRIWPFAPTLMNILNQQELALFSISIVIWPYTNELFPIFAPSSNPTKPNHCTEISKISDTWERYFYTPTSSKGHAVNFRLSKNPRKVVVLKGFRLSSFDPTLVHLAQSSSWSEISGGSAFTTSAAWWCCKVPGGAM